MSPKISFRAGEMQASPIRKLVPYADRAKERGIKVYHLNIGQPDIPSPQTALRALREFDLEIISYSHSQGEPEYIATLQNYYQYYGIKLSREQINVTTGGSEAAIFAFLAALNPGEELLIPEPYYTNYNGFAQMLGIKIVPIPTRVEEGFHLPSEGEIRSLISPKTRAILICNPNNPTGTVYTKAEIDLLVQLAEEFDLWLIADEVYREFVFEPHPDDYRSLLQIPGIEERVIVIDSISKRFSMCGARVGCLVSRNPRVMEAVLKMAQARLSSPQIEQYLAISAHQMPRSYFDEIVDIYRRRRDVVFSALQDIPGVICRKPEGAFYTIPELPVDDAEKFAKWLLTDFQEDGETVMVAPAAGFYATPERGKRQIRIAFVLNERDLKRAMDLLTSAIKKYNSG